MSRTEIRMAELRDTIRMHDHAYYVLGAPTISDRAYDALFDELKRLEAEHPELITTDSPTQRVGESPIEGFDHVTHAMPMLSVDNTYDESQLRDFDERVAKRLGGDSYQYVVDPKVDGVAVSLLYEAGRLTLAATRGDGSTGDDITQNVRTVRSVPLVLKGSEFKPILEVRGEIVWPIKAFQQFNAKRDAAGEATFANPRNATSGTLKQLDARNVAGRGLTFVAHGVGRVEPLDFATDQELFEALRDWGIPISPYRSIHASMDDIISFLPKWDERRRGLSYETDGLVIKVDQLEQRAILGATSRYPRWCIAYKFAAEQARSVLLQVDFQVGKLGTITPRAVMAPMQLSGTTVRHASLHNFDQVDRLDVRIGDTVVVEKAGEIIPQVVRVVEEKRPKNAKKIDRPTQCPVCKGEVEQDEGGVYIRCINPACPAQLKERLIHFCGRNQMDIEGAGQVVIETLVDKGFLKDYSDLYSLHERREEIANLELADKELGEKGAEKLLVAIQRSKDVDVKQLLRQCKINPIVEKMSQKIGQHVTSVTELLRAKPQRFQVLPGVDPIAAKAVCEFFHPGSREELTKRLEYLVHKSRLNIVGLGPKRVRNLVGQNLVTEIADLYELHTKRVELERLPDVHTIGAKNTANLIQGIESSKTRPLSRLLAALNIRHVGSSTALLLADHFGAMENLRTRSKDSLTRVEGVGAEMARSIAHFFDSKEGAGVVNRLREAGLCMTEPNRKVAKDSPISGQTVVVTGTFESMGRKEVQDLIKQLGGTAIGSVSKKTDLVVYGESAGSKLQKAKELGVRTIDEAEFMKIIGM